MSDARNEGLLSFEGVSFGYSRRRAPVLSAVSWQVGPGRTVLLGPNGAGKTTLLMLAAGAVRPWSGAVSLGGRCPQGRARRSYLARVAWMPQQARAVPGLSAREQVAYAGWLRGLDRSASWEEAWRVLDVVGLAGQAEQAAATLSGGQLRRVALAQALVGDPHVLLLDEPTAGLDPAQRARFRTVLDEVTTAAGRTALVSTHQVDDLTGAYDAVAVLTGGRFAYTGSVEAFLSRSQATDRVRQAEQAYESVVGVDV